MAHELLAKTDRQLGTCLRMLYAEGLHGPLEVYTAKNPKGKIEYRVILPVDDATFETLQNRYETLLS